MIDDDNNAKVDKTGVSAIKKSNAKNTVDKVVDSTDIDLSAHQSTITPPIQKDDSDVSQITEVDEGITHTEKSDIVIGNTDNFDSERELDSEIELDSETENPETVIANDELLATVPKRASQPNAHAGLSESEKMSKATPRAMPKIAVLLLGVGVLFTVLMWWMLAKTPKSETSADGADTELTTKSDSANQSAQPVKKSSYFKNEVVLDKLTLQRPPTGEGHLLTENQIGWCLYQKVRINELRSFLREGSAIMMLNEQTKEYNDSCSNFQYSKASLKIIQKELQPHVSQIKIMAQTEAVALDRQAREIDRNTQSQQIEAANLDPVPLTASKPTIMPKVSLPVAVDKPLLPNNECAVVVQSYGKVADARHYINTALTSRKYVKILQMKNGRYAVSLGTLKPTELNVLSQWKVSQVIPASSSCMKADMFIREMSISKEVPTLKKAPLVAKNPVDKKLIRKTNDADTTNQVAKQGKDSNLGSTIKKVDDKAVTYITNNSKNANANLSNKAIQNSSDVTNTVQLSQGAISSSTSSAYTDDGLSSGYIQEGTLTESEQSVAQSRNQQEIDNLLKNHAGTVQDSMPSISSPLSDIQSTNNMSDTATTDASTLDTSKQSVTVNNESSNSGGLSLTEGEPLNDADASQLLNQSE